MFSSSKSITSLHDFDKRFVENFVYESKNVKSDVYITTIDRRVNAKSVLGLLSLSIKRDDVIRIDILSSDSDYVRIEATVLTGTTSYGFSTFSGDLCRFQFQK